MIPALIMIVGIAVFAQIIWFLAWLIDCDGYHWLWPIAAYQKIDEYNEERRENESRKQKQRDITKREGTVRIIEKDGSYTAEKFIVDYGFHGVWKPLLQYGTPSGGRRYVWGYSAAIHGYNTDCVRRESLEKLQELIFDMEKKPPKPNVVGEFKVGGSNA